MTNYEGPVGAPEAGDTLAAMAAEVQEMLTRLREDMGGEATVVGLSIHEQLEKAWENGFEPTLLVRMASGEVFSIRAHRPGEGTQDYAEPEIEEPAAVPERPSRGIGWKALAIGKTVLGATKAVLDDAAHDAGVVTKEAATILREVLDEWATERYEYRKMEWEVQRIQKTTLREIRVLWERVERARKEYYAVTGSRSIVQSHGGFPTYAKKIAATEQALQAQLLRHYGYDIPPIYRRQLGQ